MGQYTRLSAQDASFLASESDTTPMVIAALAIYDGRPVMFPDGSLDFDRIRAHVEGSVHRAPSMTRQIAHVPLIGHPVWIDAPSIDLEQHVNRAAIPSPGHAQSLMDLVGRIYARPLPRDRPMWDIWVIEGLCDQRFAMLTRMHHSLIDGGAGLEVLGAFHSLSPDPDALSGPTEPWRGAPAPSPEELVLDEITHRLRGMGGMVSSLISSVAEPGRVVNRGLQLAEGLFSVVEHAARPSPLNGRVSAARRVNWLTTPLDELRALKKRLGGTLNDAVLAVTAGALRKVLAAQGRAVNEMSLRVSCPRNSAADDHRAFGNHTAGFIIELPIHIEDPQERYEAVVDATRHAKVARQADAVQFVLDLADEAMPELAGAVMSMASRFQNLVVSNVAGPPAPIYMLGCRAEELYPLTILMPNTALAITLFSYAGRMAWALCADWQLVPSLEPLERAIREEIALLGALDLPGT